MENPDERGSRRPFTIASSPLDENLMVTTKKGITSYKKKFFDLRRGETIDIFGPLGTFVLNEEDSRPKFFLAGGIGIIPYYSMLTYAYRKRLTNEICLLASFSTKSEAIFYDELTNIAKELPNTKVVYTLTKEQAEGFENGRINEGMIEKYSDVSKSVFYIVAPTAMVEAMEQLVVGMGIEEERIKSENFTGY